MFCHFNMSTDINIKNVKKLQPFKNMTIFFKRKKYSYIYGLDHLNLHFTILWSYCLMHYC